MISERAVEELISASFEGIGFAIYFGLDFEARERWSHAAVVMSRASSVIRKLNPHVLDATVDAVVAALSRPLHPTLIENNRWFHRMLTEGVPVEYTDAVTGEMRGGRARLIDFENPTNNDFLVVRQLSVVGANGKVVRPDLVLYINGGNRAEGPGQHHGRSQRCNRSTRAVQDDRSRPVRAESAARGQRRAADTRRKHH
jgi:type I restriction enzyme R subunit